MGWKLPPAKTSDDLSLENTTTGSEIPPRQPNKGDDTQYNNFVSSVTTLFLIFLLLQDFVVLRLIFTHHLNSC